MDLLVTGIPGTGKTSIGDYLRDAHGFLHIDMEVLVQFQPQGTTWDAVLAALEVQRRVVRDLVVTWGFIPGQDDEVVRALQHAGYRLTWLDGNRAAARRAFLQRGTVSEALLNVQMQRIEQLDLASFNPRLVDPFDADGNFREHAAIAADILASDS